MKRKRITPNYKNDAIERLTELRNYLNNKFFDKTTRIKLQRLGIEEFCEVRLKISQDNKEQWSYVIGATSLKPKRRKKS